MATILRKIKLNEYHGCLYWFIVFNQRGAQMNDRSKRFEIEDQQKWMEEIKHIPFIRFNASWKIQIIPPFGDAVVRFRVKLPSGLEKSVYLDSRNSLGYADEPYWEVYPYMDDVGRCPRNKVQTLLEMIENE